MYCIWNQRMLIWGYSKLVQSSTNATVAFPNPLIYQLLVLCLFLDSEHLKKTHLSDPCVPVRICFHTWSPDDVGVARLGLSHM